MTLGRLRVYAALAFSTLRVCGFGILVALNGFIVRAAMFRISIVETPAQRRLVVEGKLSGPWVAELRTTCRSANLDLQARRLVIDLSGLTVISREGEDAIADLMKEGAKFSCAGVLTRHVLQRLARRYRCEPHAN